MKENNGIKALIDQFGVDGIEFTSPSLRRVQATALSSFVPAGNAFLPGGVGYPQAGGYIADKLLPPVSSSPDGTLTAVYWTFGREGLLNQADEIGMYGEVTRADLGLTQASITLVKHSRSAWIADDERTNANAMGLDIDAAKSRLLETQINTRREALGATLLTTAANYSSASHYEALTGTNQWSHNSADPLGAIAAKMEFGRTVIGTRYNTLWLSPTAAFYLQTHPNIVKYVSGGATKGNPAIPVSLELIRAILGLDAVLVGQAVAATTPGGTISDVWNDCAGLLYVGGAGMYDPKFGCTLVSRGYPKSRVQRDEHKGEGIDVLYFTDAYTHAVQLSTAGYLWTDVTA